MQGHTYRRRRPDGTFTRWYAVIDLPPSPTGRRRQKTTTHDTKREAQAWLARTNQELRAGEVYDTKLTFAQYLTEWLDGKQALRPSTTVEYRRHIAQIFVPELGHLRLLDLRSHHIEEVFARIAAGNTRRERPISPTTQRRIHATLNSALTTAVRRGLIRRNPAATVELPTPQRATSTTWDRDQAAAFLTATTEDPLHLMYRLLLLGGLRRGEAVGLQWGDLDLDTGTLTVHRQVISLDGELIVGPPKSDAGHRTVPLDRATREQLRIRMRRARLRWAWEAEESFESRFVFTRAEGGCYHPVYVSRHFTTLVKRHGLPRIRLHDLRHTSASLGLEGGESLLEVSRRLGHSSIGVTADIYAHVSANTARESTERLAALIDGPT